MWNGYTLDISPAGSLLMENNPNNLDIFSGSTALLPMQSKMRSFPRNAMEFIETQTLFYEFIRNNDGSAFRGRGGMGGVGELEDGAEGGGGIDYCP